MATSRSTRLGPAARPIVAPDDLDDPGHLKASGRVELPPHIRWSGGPMIYDLDDRDDRARVYEQVLREGTVADVRYFVRGDHLVAQWDELVLPPEVRAAWAASLGSRRRAEA